MDEETLQARTDAAAAAAAADAAAQVLLRQEAAEKEAAAERAARAAVKRAKKKKVSCHVSQQVTLFHHVSQCQVVMLKGCVTKHQRNPSITVAPC